MFDVRGPLRTDVLNQGTSERDVDQLCASTDGKRRRAAFAGALSEGELAGVTSGVRLAGLVVRRLIVVRGGNVFAAREEQRVDAAERLESGVRLNGRKNEWRHPRGDECVGVGFVHAHARPAANDFCRRGDEDARRAAARLRVS